MSERADVYCIKCHKELLYSNEIAFDPRKQVYCNHQKLPKFFRFVDFNGNETFLNLKWRE